MKLTDERTVSDPLAELRNPATGQVDPDWIRTRLRYRHPLTFWTTAHHPVGAKMKRLTDIALSSFALLMLAPIFAAVAIAIKIDSKGPIFFAQKRVGRGGREFPFYKFRSMVTDAEKLKDQLLKQNESGQGVIFKMKNDPRITRVGRFIRKYSIDELPQFYNVLRGDMSIVGPRPPVPREVVMYDDIAFGRLDTMPGLTCIWQVNGRSAIGFRDQVRLDALYILRQGWLTDLVLMWKTVPAVLKGEGAF